VEKRRTGRLKGKTAGSEGGEGNNAAVVAQSWRGGEIAIFLAGFFAAIRARRCENERRESVEERGNKRETA